MKQIGKVTHYYNKLGVAIVELDDTIKVGDRIRIERGKQVLEQAVTSVHKEHTPVERAGKGDVVGLKIEGQVHDGATVSRLQEGE